MVLRQNSSNGIGVCMGGWVQLDCALGDGKIETPEYLRLVHRLSRQQFMEKEVVLRILAKRRSLGVY